MKFITRNFAYYTLAFTLLTILMRYSITASVDARHYTLPWFIAGAYTVITSCLGLFFGKREREASIPLYDAGFRYHFATWLILTAVSELWHGSGLMSVSENFMPWRFVEVVWAVFVAANFVSYLIARRKTIRGIEKSDLFD